MKLLLKEFQFTVHLVKNLRIKFIIYQNFIDGKIKLAMIPKFTKLK